MKLCFVGHSTSGFSSSTGGGSERQSALLAMALSARGHDVTYVVIGLGDKEETVSGVRLLSGWDPDRGLPFVRAATYRYPHLHRVLCAQDADAYYSRGAGYWTPFVVRAARERGAFSVLGLASDRDLFPDSAPALFQVRGKNLPPLVARIPHRLYAGWALPSATWVAVQNDQQADACARLGLRSATLPNIAVDPPEGLAGVEPVRDVIWAGNVTAGRRSKGLRELAALAGRLPEVSFSVVGRLDAPEHRGTVDLLGRLPNVVVAGPLMHDETQQRIAAHRIVLNTSPSEGFSNVMLEGWSLGRPSVTLWVNPSGLLSADRLGICGGGDLETTAAAVVALLREPDARAAMGERAREYVHETHAADRVCERFEQLVKRHDRDARSKPLVASSL